jgi:hypothetical protein
MMVIYKFLETLHPSIAFGYFSLWVLHGKKFFEYLQELHGVIKSQSDDAKGVASYKQCCLGDC